MRDQARRRLREAPGRCGASRAPPGKSRGPR